MGTPKRTVSEVFHAHTGRLVDKWEHYLPIYERHFAKYVGTAVKVLEIGVSHGGSLHLWRKYFGPQADIMGIDIDPRCKEYEEEGIHILIADQAKLKSGDIGPFDIVIDDGSHVIADQEASFKALWPDTRGVYLCEDCHSGYPSIAAPDGLVSLYPWIVVVERPKRLIRGKPSRELRQDEIEAINLYTDV
jgi:hypothetical protein